jgi:hypothetical protein
MVETLLSFKTSVLTRATRRIIIVTGVKTSNLKNQNMIWEEIKRRSNSGNACCHSAQNLLSSRLLSENVKIRIFKPIILPVVLYGCETWSLTLREVRRLRMFENKMLRRILGLKRDEVTRESGENYLTRSCMICILRKV